MVAPLMRGRPCARCWSTKRRRVSGCTEGGIPPVVMACPHAGHVDMHMTPSGTRTV